MNVFSRAALTVDTVQNEDAFVQRTAAELETISDSFLPTSTMKRALGVDNTMSLKQ